MSLLLCTKGKINHSICPLPDSNKASSRTSADYFTSSLVAAVAEHPFSFVRHIHGSLSFPSLKIQDLAELAPMGPNSNSYTVLSKSNHREQDQRGKKRGTVPVPESVLNDQNSSINPHIPSGLQSIPHFPKALFSHPLAVVEKRPCVFMASGESTRLLPTASLCNPEQKKKGKFPWGFIFKALLKNWDKRSGSWRCCKSRVSLPSLLFLPKGLKHQILQTKPGDTFPVWCQI